jgi:hypothetical protein
LRQQRPVDVDELREECDVEHDAGGIERGHHESLREHASLVARQPAVVVQGLRHRRAPGLDAEIDEIDGAGDLQAR